MDKNKGDARLQKRYIGLVYPMNSMVSEDIYALLKRAANPKVKKCLSENGEDIPPDEIVRTMENGINDYLMKYCDNVIWHKTAKLIDELGGIKGLHRVLYTRIDEIHVYHQKEIKQESSETKDTHKYEYLFCIYDFYHHTATSNTSSEKNKKSCCPLKEVSVRFKTKSYLDKMKTAHIRKVNIKCSNDPTVGACFSHISTMPSAICQYLKNNIVCPIEEDTETGRILINLYKKSGMWKEDISWIRKVKGTHVCNVKRVR